jgi:hypothetical protein
MIALTGGRNAVAVLTVSLMLKELRFVKESAAWAIG